MRFRDARKIQSGLFLTESCCDGFWDRELYLFGKAPPTLNYRLSTDATLRPLDRRRTRGRLVGCLVDAMGVEGILQRDQRDPGLDLAERVLGSLQDWLCRGRLPVQQLGRGGI